MEPSTAQTTAPAPSSVNDLNLEVAFPLDAPAAPPPPPPPPITYRINGARITLRECWWGTPSPLALLVWVILRIAGRRIPASTDDPPVESLAPFSVEVGALPSQVRANFETNAAPFAALGFHSPAYHAIPDPLHRTDTFLATFTHRSLPVVARLHFRSWSMKSPPAIIFTEFLTAFDDGSFLWSLSSKPDMLAPPSCTIVRAQGATPADLFLLHEKSLAASPPSRRPLPARSQPEALAIAERLHAAVRDFHIKRGVFVPLNPAERAIATAAGAPPHPDAAQSPHAHILAELDRIQRGKGGWRGPLLILIISAALFLLIGFKDVPWTIVLALVPVLFFHELGHYLAMKAFGYRDLRMFFIPAFGAAVTGRHYNIAGWKKGVVALMGPIPGIVLGIIIGLCGALWGSDLAVKAALLTLIINGFNLLPILPLDGGDVVHTVLFSRHHALDIIFRSAAALAIIALAILVGSQILTALAVVMFVSLPYTIRVSRIARELQRDGLPAASPDDQTIPTPIAERIITKLTASNRRPQTTKLVAQQTLQVFESLNTRPPGWPASVALLSAHVLSFLAAAVFSLVFLFALRGTLRDFFQAAAARPAHEITAPTLLSAGEPADAEFDAATYNTAVATFANADLARAAYEAAAPRLHPDQRASLFASTLFIRFPAADDEARTTWLAHLQGQADDVFIESAAMQTYLNIQALARTPAQAAQIQAELTEYFRLPLTTNLAAPWSPLAPPTPEQRAARQTYASLADASYGGWDDPEFVRLQEAMTQAQRRGEQAEYKSLAAKQQSLLTSLQHRHVQKIADNAPTPAQRELAQRYLELMQTLDPDEFYLSAPEQLAPYLGPAPSGAGDPPGPIDATYALSGYATQVHLILNLNYIDLADPASGAAAITQWLTAKGCAGLRYEYIAEPAYDDFELEGELWDEPTDPQ